LPLEGHELNKAVLIDLEEHVAPDGFEIGREDAVGARPHDRQADALEIAEASPAIGEALGEALIGQACRALSASSACSPPASLLLLSATILSDASWSVPRATSAVAPRASEAKDDYGEEEAAWSLHGGHESGSECWKEYGGTESQALTLTRANRRCGIWRPIAPDFHRANVR
jgi:hypothetical protein